MRKYAVKTIFVQFELILEDASHILTKQLELRIEYSLLHMLYLSHQNSLNINKHHFVNTKYHNF